MNIDSAYPSQFLKASDLGDKSPVVTIDRIEVEPVGRTKEMKPIVYFQGKDKGLVLNKTNARKIAELTGSKDTDDWTGCQVRIYATETSFEGDMVECIRIKAAAAPTKPVTQKKPEPVAATPSNFIEEDDDSNVPF